MVAKSNFLFTKCEKKITLNPAGVNAYKVVQRHAETKTE